MSKSTIPITAGKCLFQRLMSHGKVFSVLECVCVCVLISIPINNKINNRFFFSFFSYMFNNFNIFLTIFFYTPLRLREQFSNF